LHSVQSSGGITIAVISGRIVAKLIELYGFLDAKRVLEGGRQAAFKEEARAAG
jgi:hypothetical protein